MIIKKNRYKDKIERQFLLYTLIPLFVLSVLFFSFIVIADKLGDEKMSRDALNAIHAELNDVYDRYTKVIHEMSIDEQLIIDIQSEVDEVQLYQYYYELNANQMIRSSMYLYDLEGQLLFKSEDGFIDDSYFNVSIKRIIRILEVEPFKMQGVSVYLKNFGNQYVLASTLGEHDVLGFVVFYINNEDMEKLLSRREVSHMILTDTLDNIVASTSNELKRDLRKFSKDNHIVKLTERIEYTVNYKENNKLGLHIYALNYKTNLMYRYQIFFAFFIVVFVLLYILIKWVSSNLARKNATSVDRLIQTIEYIKQGNWDFDLQITTNDEFEQLEKEIKLMSTTIHKIMMYNQELQTLNHQSQLKELESKFNPHFLYNTLETIRYLIYENPNEASKTILQLTRILRYSISQNNELNDLNEDIRYVKDYLSILKCRFEDRLDYQLFIKVTNAHIKIPRLLIQPIIENSVKYGMNHQKQLQLTIHIIEENNVLKMTIQDNAGGIEKQMMETIQEAISKRKNILNHHGIILTNRRLKMIYKDKATMHFENRHHGLKVTIEIALEGETHV